MMMTRGATLALAAGFISAQQQGDGTVTAGRALVGKDGLVPPM